MVFPEFTLACIDIIGPQAAPPFIPTHGHIACGIDGYLTVGIQSVEYKPDSWCFTDTESAGALGRIIDGPIRSFKDIERAESALRAILLHDYIEILIPCVKGKVNDLIQYIRFDKERRNDATIAAFRAAPCRDFFFATEYINVSNGKIVNSSNPQSSIVGLSLEDDKQIFKEISIQTAEIATSLPLSIDATTYYTDQYFTSPLSLGDTCFIDSLYKRIYKPWMEIAQSQPSFHIDVKLPPFLAIVLSRANKRVDLPTVIKNLRDELTSVRHDLNRMNSLLDSTMSQADIMNQVQNINESFDAIVAEARLTDAMRRWRRILSVFSFSKPVRQIYSIAADPLSFDLNKFKELYNSTSEAVRKNPRIISRCIPATKFAELLRTDSIRETIKTHFNDYEMRLLKLKK